MTTPKEVADMEISTLMKTLREYIDSNTTNHTSKRYFKCCVVDGGIIKAKKINFIFHRYAPSYTELTEYEIVLFTAMMRNVILDEAKVILEKELNFLSFDKRLAGVNVCVNVEKNTLDVEILLPIRAVYY
jgi:hypothetical protein